MQPLLALSRAIDRLNTLVGKGALWLVLLAVLISSMNATTRKLFDMSSNAWLEMQWYLFSVIFLCCAGYALLHNEHIRIDIISSRLRPKERYWIDIVGHVFFLLPLSAIMVYEAWPYFIAAFGVDSRGFFADVGRLLGFLFGTTTEVFKPEQSSNAGGLIRWPAKALIVIGFALLFLQGVSELVKRVAVLKGLIPDPYAAKSGPH